MRQTKSGWTPHREEHTFFYEAASRGMLYLSSFNKSQMDLPPYVAVVL